MKPRLIFIPVILFYFFNQVTAQTIYTDVLVIGGGTGGTAAGIQTSR